MFMPHAHMNSSKHKAYLVCIRKVMDKITTTLKTENIKTIFNVNNIKNSLEFHKAPLLFDQLLTI